MILAPTGGTPRAVAVIAVVILTVVVLVRAANGQERQGTKCARATERSSPMP
jgi:hypothetical protein